MRECPYEHSYESTDAWVSIERGERWALVTGPCTVAPFYRLFSPILAPLCLHPDKACPREEER